MIAKEIVKTIIKEGQELLENVDLNERSYSFEDNGRYVLVGIRQAGKSYLLYQRAKQLLREGTDIPRCRMMTQGKGRLKPLQDLTSSIR